MARQRAPGRGRWFTAHVGFDHISMAAGCPGTSEEIPDMTLLPPW
jgi:hypothetical protein